MTQPVPISLVQNLPLFLGVEARETEALLKSSRIVKYPAGKTIFRHGDAVTHFYIIAGGTVQVFRQSPDGEEKTLGVLNAGQALCENEILDSCSSHRANAVAVHDVVLLEFPVAWLKETAKKCSAFALNLLSLIASQAYMAEIEAEQRASMSAAQLVACFLQRLCVLHDFDHRGFELPYSKTLIASRLGMELETFSRTLKTLGEEGIEVKGSHVAIRDPQRIEHYVCGVCSIVEDCPTRKTLKKKTSSASDIPTA